MRKLYVELVLCVLGRDLGWFSVKKLFTTHEILNKKSRHCELLRIMKQSVDPWYIARTWKPYQNFGWMIPKCIWRKHYPTISFETKKMIWKSSMNLSIGNLKVEGRCYIDVGDGNCLCWRPFSGIDDRFFTLKSHQHNDSATNHVCSDVGEKCMLTKNLYAGLRAPWCWWNVCWWSSMLVNMYEIACW